MAPVTDRQSPAILRGLSGSLKKTAEQKLIKIGLQAMINDAWLA